MTTPYPHNIRNDPLVPLVPSSVSNNDASPLLPNIPDGSQFTLHLYCPTRPCPHWGCGLRIFVLATVPLVLCPPCCFPCALFGRVGGGDGFVELTAALGREMGDGRWDNGR